MREVKALIVAPTMAQANLIADMQNLGRMDWRYINDRIRAMGLRPRHGLRVLAGGSHPRGAEFWETIEYLTGAGFNVEWINT